MEKRIVLLHGWGAKSGKLEALANGLEKLGWETMNLDMPGFGQPSPNEVWGVKEYGKWVMTEVNKKWKKGTYVVFGHSFGGRVTIKLAAEGEISKAVLCAPGGLSRPSGLKRKMFAWLAKTGKKLGFERYRGMLYKLAREHDYEKTQGVMREVFKKVVEEDLKPRLREILVPTLILWGRKDRMVPFTDGELAGQRIKNSKLVLFTDQGHRLPYELPEELAKIIDEWIR